MFRLLLASALLLVGGCDSLGKFAKDVIAADRAARERECQDQTVAINTRSRYVYSRTITCPGQEPQHYLIYQGR